MPELKFFEIRDRGTCISAVATGLYGQCDQRENWLMERAGYGRDPLLRDEVILSYLESGESKSDPYSWCDRTMTTAHKYIKEHWLELSSGDLVDVEHILGEADTPKPTEMK